MTNCLICESNDSRTVWSKPPVRIEKCNACKVLFVAARPSESEILELYDSDALIRDRPDPFAKEEGPPPKWKQEEHQFLLECIASMGCSRGKLLDVGCFSGMFLRNATERGFEVAGVEPNRDAFLHVRNVLGFEVVHGGLRSALFPADAFSAVSYLDVIEHVPDPVLELNEAFRVMRSRAILILTTPNVNGLPQRILRAKRRLTREQTPCPIDDVPWHLWGFTRECLARCVRKSGFRVAKSVWLKPSAVTTNTGAGSSIEKRLGLRIAAKVSEWVKLSDRMAMFAQKP